MRLFYLISTILLSVISVKVQAQKDSIIKANNNKVVLLDTVKPVKDSMALALAQKDTAQKKKEFDLKLIHLTHYRYYFVDNYSLNSKFVKYQIAFSISTIDCNLER